MDIKYFCPQWGSKDLDHREFVKKVKESGYDGIEMSLPLDEKEKQAVLDVIKEYDLLYLAQHWETVTTDFEEHKKEYRKRIENLATANPLLINSQTGRDFFTFEQNAGLIGIADEVSKKHGIKVLHETHRGKFSFAAHITAEFMKKLPGLQLTLDMSHWCCVAETLLKDQQEAVELAVERAGHIHARVGYMEGPQIPDPRVPEWQNEVDVHVDVWKRIVDKNRKDGKSVFTITSEFGPYPYMIHLPYTQQPLTSQWEVNVHMMNMLKSKL